MGRRRRRRREDETTAQLILENAHHGKFVATTTLSGLQTVQQPHLNTQKTQIYHLNVCYQITLHIRIGSTFV